MHPKKDLLSEIEQKYPELSKGPRPSHDEHETAGDHFKELSRQLHELPKEKKAFLGGALSRLAPAGSSIGEHLAKHDNLYDLAGLGLLAAPAAGDVISQTRKPKGERDRGHLMHDAAELGGLGLIAAPVAAHALGFKHAAPAFFDELEKMGMVSDEEAARALQSLQSLEDNKPSMNQTLGYMGLGATATPAIHAVANVIRGRPPFEGETGMLKLRDAASQAFKGGVGGTLVSIGQQQLDRQHNMGKLRAYMNEQGAEKTGAEAHAIPPPPASGNVIHLPKTPKVPIVDDNPVKYVTPNTTVHSLTNSTDIPPIKRKVAGVPPPLPTGGGMAGALFGGMKSSPGVKVSPGYVKAPSARGLAGSGTPSMPMPKVAGFLDSVKKIALTDVGGPKGILTPAGQAAAHGVPKVKKPGDDFKAWQARQAMKTAEA